MYNQFMMHGQKNMKPSWLHNSAGAVRVTVFSGNRSCCPAL